LIRALNQSIACRRTEYDHGRSGLSISFPSGRPTPSTTTLRPRLRRRRRRRSRSLADSKLDHGTARDRGRRGGGRRSLPTRPRSKRRSAGGASAGRPNSLSYQGSAVSKSVIATPGRMSLMLDMRSSPICRVGLTVMTGPASQAHRSSSECRPLRLGCSRPWGAARTQPANGRFS
jgi:hypothetical protein